MEVSNILTGIITALATLLAVFIAFALRPNHTNNLIAQIRNNRQDIELLKQELKFIRENLLDIKTMLKEKK